MATGSRGAAVGRWDEKGVCWKRSAGNWNLPAFTGSGGEENKQTSPPSSSSPLPLTSPFKAAIYFTNRTNRQTKDVDFGDREASGAGFHSDLYYRILDSDWSEAIISTATIHLVHGGYFTNNNKISVCVIEIFMME